MIISCFTLVLFQTKQRDRQGYTPTDKQSDKLTDIPNDTQNDITITSTYHLTSLETDGDTETDKSTDKSHDKISQRSDHDHIETANNGSNGTSSRNTDKGTDKNSNKQTDSQTDDQTDSQTDYSNSTTDKSIVILTTPPPALSHGTMVRPLSDMAFSEQLQYLDKLLLGLDPGYSPPVLAPLHPLYTTVLAPEADMGQKVRSYERRRRRCGQCERAGNRASWGSCKGEEADEVSPSTDSSFENKLRALRVEHCTRLREFYERRAALDTVPDKKGGSLKKRLLSRFQRWGMFGKKGGNFEREKSRGSFGVLTSSSFNVSSRS